MRQKPLYTTTTLVKTRLETNLRGMNPTQSYEGNHGGIPLLLPPLSQVPKTELAVEQPQTKLSDVGCRISFTEITENLRVYFTQKQKLLPLLNLSASYKNHNRTQYTLFKPRTLDLSKQTAAPIRQHFIHKPVPCVIRPIA